MMKKAQISTEMIIAISIIVFIFIGLLAIVFDKRIEIRNTEKYIDERETCLKVANAITSVFINKVQISMTIYQSVNITKNLVRVNEITCSFPIGEISNYNINKGKILLQNINNQVIIQNV